MTYEEVLNRVNQQKKSIDGYPPKFIFVGTVEEYKVIVDALEKQIPKKPVEGKKYEFFTEYSCPCCGQTIDWSKE